MTDKSLHDKDLIAVRQIYDKSHESRDKALLTLCSASLGLSLTFYEKVYCGHVLWLLMLTWICLTASMLATLYSFITAAYTADRLNSFMVDKKRYEGDAKFIAVINRGAAYTKHLNLVSISGFTCGVFLFIIFAIVNTWQGKHMADPRELQNGLPPLSSMMPNGGIQKGTPPLSSTLPTAPAAPAPAPAAPAPAPASNGNK